ncbi:ribonuclease H [Senna tora]|uniref:Ribonuclease H n=1 Tax=Senna tora TaxID=362788 RepID=A0A834XEM1_9FABA|nr:ribonuclease H [Senna tora]
MEGEVEDLTAEEEDNLNRSTKKIKTTEGAGASIVLDSLETPESQSNPMEECQIEEIKMSDTIPTLDAVPNDEVKSVRRELLTDPNQGNISYKEKLIGINGRDKDFFITTSNSKGMGSGSRFEIINSVEEEGMDIDQQPKVQEQPQHVVQQIIKPHGSMDLGSQSPQRNKGCKIKPKKVETQVLGGKKPISATSSSVIPKRTVKPSNEKSQSHTLVTSIHMGTKNLSMNLNNKSPSKITEGVPKAPTKHPTNLGSERLGMDSKMKEQLSLMKVAEKQITDSELKQIWRKIWRCNIPERTRFFLWSFCHGKIMTNSQRCSRGFSNNSTCFRCGHPNETPIHAIRDCPQVLPLWKNLIPQQVWYRFCNVNNHDWLKLNLCNNIGSKKCEDWGAFFAISCWQIWKQRNDCLFNKVKDKACSLLPIIESHYKEIMTVGKLKNSVKDRGFLVEAVVEERLSSPKSYLPISGKEIVNVFLNHEISGERIPFYTPFNFCSYF